MSTVLLVDGHSQAYRAFFGVKTPLSTRSGEPTTAVYGFIRKFLSVLREYKPDFAAVAFDLGDTWRHSEYSDYKATRDAMPDEMRPQLGRIEQFLQAMHVPIVTYENYEADDVLGTLAEQAAAAGHDVLILTGDRDMFQLINDKIRILYTKGGPNPETVIYGQDEVEERYGLSPAQFVDLKALIGDSSDNIPGVTGVGEKTAAKFLNEYGDVSNLYAHIEEVSGPKTRQNLAEAKEAVERNQRLMRIVTDLDVTFDADTYRTGEFNRDAILDLFHELEFRSLVRELPGAEQLPGPGGDGQMALFTADANGDTPPIPEGATYRQVDTPEGLEEVVAALQAAELISFDVETTSTDAMQADLVGLGLAWAVGEAAYIPVAHTEGDQLPWDEVQAKLAPIFADAHKTFLAHNGKYDLTVCRRYGLDIAGPIHDTMIMAWVLDPGSRNLGLKAQAAERLGWHMTEITALIGTGRKQITMDAVAIDQACAYCGADVDATLRIFEKLSAQLHETGMWDLYAELELPLLPVLTDMEMTGVLLDLPYLKVMSNRFAERLHELEQELFKLVGHEFNLRSPQQLSQVLFEELEFPTKGMKKTSSGHYSTAVATLEQLAARRDELSDKQRRALEIIGEQRQVEKLRGTYVDALPTLVNPQTGRVHTSFNQAGAVTGRMSSSNPNLQNIPIRTELGREIRRAFIAPQGWRLISADYSQVELRILAHITREKALVDSFIADQDIHAVTASRLFHVPLEQVDRDQRTLAKTINFATIYGISEFGLSSRTDMSRDEARTFLERYFDSYPKVREYIAETIRKANEEGYVETLLGRKRFFPELSNKRLPYNQRQASERQAINAPIQGTNADIMKIAMIRLHDELRTGTLQARMLLQVHDELVLEAPEAEVDATVDLVRHVMETAYQLAVPLKVDVEIGPDWYNLESA